MSKTIPPTQKTISLEALAHFHRLIQDHLTPLLETYGEYVLNESMLPPQVKETAVAIRQKYPDGPLNESQLICMLRVEWDRLLFRKSEGHAVGVDLLKSDAPSPSAIYTTQCPFCGDRDCLSVVEVTLAYAEGRVVEVEVPLSADGFSILGQVSPSIQDLSTEDEKVACYQCDERFDLELVSLDAQWPHSTLP